MIKKFHNTLFADDDIPFFDKGLRNVTFSSDEMCTLSVDLNNINLHDVNFDKGETETIIHVRHMAWRNRIKQRKIFKKDISKELMPLA